MSRMCLDGWKNHPWGSLTLRAGVPNDETLQQVPTFRSLDSLLSNAYRIRARVGVKVATYDEPTAPDTARTGLTYIERKGDAAMLFSLMDELLTREQRAVLDAMHEGAGEQRTAALTLFLSRFAKMTRNPTLLQHILMRQFVYGEEYCPSQREIARALSIPKSTVDDLDQRVSAALKKLIHDAHERLRPACERRGWIARRDVDSGRE